MTWWKNPSMNEGSINLLLKIRWFSSFPFLCFRVVWGWWFFFHRISSHVSRLCMVSSCFTNTFSTKKLKCGLIHSRERVKISSRLRIFYDSKVMPGRGYVRCFPPQKVNSWKIVERSTDWGQKESHWLLMVGFWWSRRLSQASWYTYIYIYTHRATTHFWKKSGYVLETVPIDRLQPSAYFPGFFDKNVSRPSIPSISEFICSSHGLKDKSLQAATISCSEGQIALRRFF